MYLKPLRFIAKNSDSSTFIQVVRARVDAYFENQHLSKKYNQAMILKTMIMLAAYILPFIIYIYTNPSMPVSLALWAIMAFGMSGIGMCIMHDANHNAYTSSHKLNQFLGYSINLAGAFAFNWKIQHNVLHHTYTNITYYDDDIDDKAILKLSPHTQVKWYHRYQYIYAFIFYSIATLYWTFIKDFLQFIRYKNEGLNKNSFSENSLLLLRLILTKVLYLFIVLYIPYLYFGIPLQKTVLCFIFMHVIAGLVLTTIFQLAHTIVGTSHPMPNENLIIENDWAVHQMNTTANFAKNSKFITWYIGGLNYQIEHHLFPNICHIHYPHISEIVKNTAAEFHINYLELNTFTDAFKAHIAALKKFGEMK